jgi:hypothetical protein
MSVAFVTDQLSVVLLPLLIEFDVAVKLLMIGAGTIGGPELIPLPPQPEASTAIADKRTIAAKPR